MSATVHVPSWPSDEGHRDAIDTLLGMADAEARWGNHGRALVLLERVEQIVGSLSPGYERLRARCERDGRGLGQPGPRGVQFPHAVVTPPRGSGGRPPRR